MTVALMKSQRPKGINKFNSLAQFKRNKPSHFIGGYDHEKA